MINRGAYSLGKLFVLSTIFIILGATCAASVTMLVSPIIQHPPNFILLTDKDTYYVKEAIIIYLVNTLEENITFKDDAYGLHFEKWVDGKWEILVSIGNSSRTSALQPIGEGAYKAVATYELGENFIEGKYRVISVGEISRGDQIITVATYKVFDLVAKPSPTTMLLLINVTTDKNIYPQDEDVIITIKNESNETLVFGNSAYDLFFEKWNGASWEFYTGVPGESVLTFLNPEETVEIFYTLGGQVDKPFPAGKYRVISMASIQVWGYAEFRVE